MKICIIIFQCFNSTPISLRSVENGEDHIKHKGNDAAINNQSMNTGIMINILWLTPLRSMLKMTNTVHQRSPFLLTGHFLGASVQPKLAPLKKKDRGPNVRLPSYFCFCLRLSEPGSNDNLHLKYFLSSLILGSWCRGLRMRRGGLRAHSVFDNNPFIIKVRAVLDPTHEGSKKRKQWRAVTSGLGRHWHFNSKWVRLRERKGRKSDWNFFQIIWEINGIFFLNL